MIFTKLKSTKVNIDEVVNNFIGEDRIHELLFIVPTNRKVRQLKKDLIDLSKNKILSDIHVETLSTFSESILREKEQFVELNEATSSILISGAAREVELKYFNKHKNELPKGTLDKLRRIFSEYKKMGIWPDDLESNLSSLNDSERLKGKDIVSIYRKYLESCYNLNALETGDVYQKILYLNKNEFENIFKSKFGRVTLAIVHGFDEFTLPEIDIIDKVSTALNDNIYVELDYFNFNPKLFAHLKRSKDKFLEKGFHKVEDLRNEEDKGFRKRVRNNLFKPVLSTEINRKKFNVSKIVCKNRYDEVETIAKEIKKLVITKDVKPSKIAVVFNLIENYSDIIRDVFNEYELVFNLSDRLTLKETRPVNDLLNFLYIIEDDYYYESILRAINGSFIDIEIHNKSGLKYFFSENDFIRGRGYLLALLNENTNDHKDLLETISKIDNLLERFRSKLTFDEFYNELVKLATNLNIPGKILELRDLAEANTKGFTYFFEVLNEVFHLLKKDYGKDTKFSLDFYLDQIRIILNWARYNVKEKSEFGVQVTTLDEIRGLDYDYLFIGGMVDGELPLRYNPEIFISPEIKKRRQAFHLTKQRYLFYQALSVWKKGLYLIVPQFEENKDLSESVFIKELENYFELNKINSSEYENLIYSKFENSVEEEAEELNLIGLNTEDETIKEYFSEYSQRVYSASQLELYAKCSYKFFLERILKLKALEIPDEEIDRRDLGSKLHNILSKFYEWVNENNISIINEFEKSKQKLISLAEDEFEDYEKFDSRAFIEKEKIFGVNGDFENSILGKFLETESNENSKTVKLEYAFGYQDNPIELKGVKFKGRIDRIDIKNDKFEIIDYKLNGKKPSTDDIVNVFSIQLPLYVFALEKASKDILGADYQPGAMTIYSLKLDDFGKKELKERGNKTSFDLITKIKEDFLEKLKEYVDSLSRGEFRLSDYPKRENDICKYCKLDSICRVKEVDK